MHFTQLKYEISGLAIAVMGIHNLLPFVKNACRQVDFFNRISYYFLFLQDQYNNVNIFFVSSFAYSSKSDKGKIIIYCQWPWIVFVLFIFHFSYSFNVFILCVQHNILCLLCIVNKYYEKNLELFFFREISVNLHTSQLL